VDPDELRFEPLRQGRGWYFVEYSPPLPNYRFSTLRVVVVDEQPAGRIAEVMENEATAWLRRYPIPLMVSAFNPVEDLIDLSSVRPCNHLMAVARGPDHKPTFHWRLLSNDELPEYALDRSLIANLFAALKWKSGRQINEQAEAEIQRLRLGWWMVFLWAVVVPLIVAILEWWSDLLGLAVLAYSFGKAIVHALRLTGKLPKAAAQSKKEAEELRARHHDYHCVQNPAGFERLKAENFDRWSRERTRATASTLASPSESDS
jgi:hypothetical protein